MTTFNLIHASNPSQPSPIIELIMDDDIRAQTIVVLTSGKGLEHALIIRRNKQGNKVGPMDETGKRRDSPIFPSVISALPQVASIVDVASANSPTSPATKQKNSSTTS